MVAGEEFIINFTEDLAFISDTKSLAISQLNLPAFEAFFPPVGQQFGANNPNNCPGIL